MNEENDESDRPARVSLADSEGRRLLVVTFVALVLACGSHACAAKVERDVDTTATPIAGTAGAGDAAPVIESDWCGVRSVLEAKCQRCHAAPPEHGAPFSLVTYDDTQQVNAHGEARFVQIEAAISKDYMPPSFITLDPPVSALTDGERAALLGWCRAGAPDATCSD
jgi:uncharacterized membrane protein